MRKNQSQLVLNSVNGKISPVYFCATALYWGYVHSTVQWNWEDWRLEWRGRKRRDCSAVGSENRERKERGRDEARGPTVPLLACGCATPLCLPMDGYIALASLAVAVSVLCRLSLSFFLSSLFSSLSKISSQKGRRRKKLAELN